jgi:outer membrane protein OmpA-like peptidoglycan-associated protein
VLHCGILRPILMLPLLLLPACTPDRSISPVAWWHQLQGGVIASQRPPPPGVTDPYPNLASVPPRPPPPNAGEQTAIAAGLDVDRVTAEQAAAQDPLPQPHAATAPAAPATPPPPAGNATAQVAAAEAPPPPAATPAAPRPAAPATQPAARAAEATAPAAAGPPTPGVMGPLPVMPAAPPPPPVLTGLAIPLPPPAAPPASPNLAGVKPTETVIVPFPLGSAELPAQAAASLKALATRRHGAPVAVVARGEAASSAPDAQAAALALGLKRAQVMAAALTAAGVPSAAVRIDAQALGRGGEVRLID